MEVIQNFPGTFDSNLPLVINIRASTLKKKFFKEQPYDSTVGKIFYNLTEFLMHYYRAYKAFTQGRHIMLICRSFTGFSNNAQLLASNIASVCTNNFQKLKLQEEMKDWFVTFDTFVYNVPKIEIAEMEMQKRREAVVRKTITIVAELYYSKEELHKKSIQERKKMIIKKGDKWENYPEEFRLGVFFSSKK